jgi:hypothetical protein
MLYAKVATSMFGLRNRFACLLRQGEHRPDAGSERLGTVVKGQGDDMQWVRASVHRRRLATQIGGLAPFPTSLLRCLPASADTQADLLGHR